MKEGDIIVIATAPNVMIHARLKQPLVSGWLAEIICKKGIEFMRNSGHPAQAGYTIWTHSDKIGYEYERSKKKCHPATISAFLKKKWSYIKHTAETKVSRKLKKVIIWRILSFSVASLISYIYLGEFKRSLELTVILTVILTTIQYYYESFWEKETT